MAKMVVRVYFRQLNKASLIAAATVNWGLLLRFCLYHAFLVYLRHHL